MSDNSASSLDASDVAARPLVKMVDVTKTFQMGEVEVRALAGVSLDIFAGEMVVMVGPSGSGKTTILNIVGGLDSASSGDVYYRDIDLAGMSDRELTRYRRNEVGFVFQFYNLVPNLTALENVLVATELVREPMDAHEVLDLVGLADRADHFPAQLSGGEQQRVAIARAIAKNPELVLCDEPTGALDYRTGKSVLGLLVRLKRELGKTIVVITHNAEIGHIADRVVRLSSGAIVELVANERPLPPEDLVW
ncbi:MAG: ABC transporter ATP-binding protein [Planctomycetales bacterium]|nr:ABC transporter ATP-binding protein [Planctomycetales bacterium]